MARNPYYTSGHWRTLRSAAIKRDHGRCTVPGCGSTHRLTVNHKTPRPRGATGPTPFDVLENLETLCAVHDNQIKERADGTRRNDGELSPIGVDLAGRPTDPSHPWNARKG